MKSRWVVVFALVAVMGLALAGGAMAGASKAPLASSGVVSTIQPQAPVTAAADPYVAESPFTSEAPIPVVSCQVYAYTCVFDGGPCGPGGVCHCQYRPTGWICGR